MSESWRAKVLRVPSMLPWGRDIDGCSNRGNGCLQRGAKLLQTVLCGPAAPPKKPLLHPPSRLPVNLCRWQHHHVCFSATVGLHTKRFVTSFAIAGHRAIRAPNPTLCTSTPHKHPFIHWSIPPSRAVAVRFVITLNEAKRKRDGVSWENPNITTISICKSLELERNSRIIYNNQRYTNQRVIFCRFYLQIIEPCASSKEDNIEQMNVGGWWVRAEKEWCRKNQHVTTKIFRLSLFESLSSSQMRNEHIFSVDITMNTRYSCYLAGNWSQKRNECMHTCSMMIIK